jgi:penicillin-binding protein 2
VGSARPSTRPWLLAVSALALGSVSSQGTQGAAEAVWRLLPSVRGEILDRNGVPLAESRAAFNLYVVPRLYGSEERARLIELLDLDAEEITQLDGRVAPAGDQTGDRAVLVLEDIGRARANRVEGARRTLGGAALVNLDRRRRYPHGELTAHLVGYASQATPEELAEAQLPPDASERVGRHGVEQALDTWLQGNPGVERFSITTEGEREPASFERPAAGHDVMLTVDLELQRVAASALGEEEAGAVVVAEVETGRILALVSKPSFDANAMIGPGAREELRLEGDPRRPLLDRTVTAFPPGSTYKLVTAVTGLESIPGIREEERTCTGSRQVGRRTMYDMGVHGTIDFVEALAVSCNVYFWTVAERVGIDAIAGTARDFGFGTRTGIGINDEEAGLVPDRTTYDLEGPDGLAHTLRTAIGNGDVRANAIQLAMAYAAVANGGRLQEPQLIRRIQTASGEIVQDRPPVLRRRIAVSPFTLDTIREGMRRAVNTAGGTGFAARKGAIPMAGKTGTALPPAGEDRDTSHAWFVSYAPIDQPELVVVVFVEHGGVGGKVAAPIGRTIVDRSFAVLRRQKRAVRSRARSREHQPRRRICAVHPAPRRSCASREPRPCLRAGTHLASVMVEEAAPCSSEPSSSPSTSPRAPRTRRSGRSISRAATAHP